MSTASRSARETLSILIGGCSGAAYEPRGSVEKKSPNVEIFNAQQGQQPYMVRPKGR
jgi:hypothetical protein